MRKLLLIIPLLFVAGCTTTRYVPVDRVHHDSIYITRERTDTFIQRDSILQYTQGDTIREVRIKYIERYRNLTDTIFKERTDTMTKVVEVVKEKELKPRQKIAMQFGYIAMLVLVGAILIWIRNLIRR